MDPLGGQAKNWDFKDVHVDDSGKVRYGGKTYQMILHQDGKPIPIADKAIVELYVNTVKQALPFLPPDTAQASSTQTTPQPQRVDLTSIAITNGGNAIQFRNKTINPSTDTTQRTNLDQSIHDVWSATLAYVSRSSLTPSSLPASSSAQSSSTTPLPSLPELPELPPLDPNAPPLLKIPSSQVTFEEAEAPAEPIAARAPQRPPSIAVPSLSEAERLGQTKAIAQQVLHDRLINLMEKTPQAYNLVFNNRMGDLRQNIDGMHQEIANLPELQDRYDQALAQVPGHIEQLVNAKNGEADAIENQILALDSASDLNALEEQIAATSRNLAKLENELLSAIEQELGGQIHDICSEVLDLPGPVGRATVPLIRPFQELHAKGIKGIIKQLRKDITQTEGWWNPLESLLPFHQGDYIRMTPASDLYRQRDSLLPAGLGITMAASSFKKDEDVHMPINCWKVEQQMAGDKISYTRGGVSDTEERVENLLNIKGAEYFEKYPEMLEGPEPITIPIVSVGLLSLHGKEKKMWDKQYEQFERFQNDPFPLQLKFQDGELIRTVLVQFDIAAYNHGPAFDAIPWRDSAINQEARRKSDARCDAYINRLNARAFALATIENKTPQQEEELLRLYEDRAEVIFLTKLTKLTDSGNSYLIPTAYLMRDIKTGAVGHVHCKSGKDRTGMFVTEEQKLHLLLAERRKARDVIRQREGPNQIQCNLQLNEYDQSLLKKNSWFTMRPPQAASPYISQEDDKAKHARTSMYLLQQNGALNKMNLGRTGMKSTNDWWRPDNPTRIGKYADVASDNSGWVES
jgi:hypothetical protein